MLPMFFSAWIHFFFSKLLTSWASQAALMVKNPPANAGDIGDVGSIPGSARSPGGGHGNLLQYSYLENPVDRAAWPATVQRIAKSQTRLKWLGTLTSYFNVLLFLRIFENIMYFLFYWITFLSLYLLKSSLSFRAWNKCHSSLKSFLIP